MITPQLAEHSQAMIEQHKLTFDLLTDPGNRVAAEFGLRFTLPEDLRALYEGFGADLALLHGEDSWTLPMPGRFVIDTRAKIRSVDVDPDYTVRPEPEAALEVVASL